MVPDSGRSPIPTRVEAMERLLEIASRLAEGMEADTIGRGLTVARAEVVWIVHHRGPMRQRDLADLLRVTPRNVTGLLDGLELTGFVARTRHPEDRRAALIKLTPMGEAVAAALSGDQEEFADYLFDGFGATELARLVTTANKLLARLRDRGYSDMRYDALQRWAAQESSSIQTTWGRAAT